MHFRFSFSIKNYFVQYLGIHATLHFLSNSAEAAAAAAKKIKSLRGHTKNPHTADTKGRTLSLQFGE